MAIGTILTIAGIVSSIAAKGISAGVSASRARQLAVAEEEEAKKTAAQGRQVERQRDRRRNLGTLGRQAEKRVAATGASREKSTARPSARGALDPQQAPQRAMAPKPGIAPQAAPPPAAPASSNIGAGIAQGLQVGSQIAEGAIAGAQQARAERGEMDRAAEIERLRDEEYKKAMSGLTKDVNLEAMDFQQAAGALPSRNARSFNQDLVGTFRKFSGRRAA